MSTNQESRQWIFNNQSFSKTMLSVGVGYSEITSLRVNEYYLALSLGQTSTRFLVLSLHNNVGRLGGRLFVA